MAKEPSLPNKALSKATKSRNIRILDVGQCGVDGPRMAELWKSEIGATVDQAATADEAIRKAADAHYDLILVNRLLASDGSSGMDVIKRLLQKKPCPILLVSDIQEAQEQAISLGADPGFGKADLNSPATIELIRRVVG